MITTSRLRLLPAPLPLPEDDLPSRAEMAWLLQTPVPPSWPSILHSVPMLARLLSDVPKPGPNGGWGLYYAVSNGADTALDGATR